jgi:hypothetical protein
MSEYLIQDSTLTDIADAIRAKDGSSAPILTEDMADAIAAIPSGGGLELIAEATTTEDVEAFRVDIPAAKQNMAAYLVECDCTVLIGTASTNNRYGCPRLNSIAVGPPYAKRGADNQYTIAIGRGADGTYRMILRSANIYPAQNSESSVEYIAFVGYYTGNLVAAGSTIKVYGIGDPT